MTMHYEPIRPHYVANMTEAQVTARLNAIHEQLSDRGAPLKWHERLRLEDEALSLTRALEGSRKTTPPPAVQNTAPAPACTSRVVRQVVRRAANGRPVEVKDLVVNSPTPKRVSGRVANEVVKQVAADVQARLRTIGVRLARAEKAASTLNVERAPTHVAPVAYYALRNG
jgi:hypothetical protein